MLGSIEAMAIHQTTDFDKKLQHLKMQLNGKPVAVKFNSSTVATHSPASDDSYLRRDLLKTTFLGLAIVAAQFVLSIVI